MPNHNFLFPSGFKWGTATSSHQVEGNLTNNDWYAAEQEGGYVFENQTAGQACDWWNRAEEDFDRMVALNQNAHRLSIEWSRVEPQPNVWDEDALARYREMLIGLRERGIEPMVTLHHFTNPLWLAEMGGWANEEVILYFRRYVRKVVKALGDLTNLWCTINEPGVMLLHTYISGRWLPGKRDLSGAIKAAHNIALAHGAAYHLIHEMQPDAQVGMAKHMVDLSPARFWAIPDMMGSSLAHRVFNDMMLGSVVQGIMRVPGRRAIRLPGAARTLDWLGVNYYQRYRVLVRLLARGRQFVDVVTHPRAEQGPGEWGEIYPLGMFNTLQRLWKHYRVPMFITENGIPGPTDEDRPRFIVTHLHQLWRAIQRGIPVQGYYFWSLVDNFEWTEGYDPRFRFGLIGVDFETQERHIRPSGHLYGRIAENGGLLRETIEQFTPVLVPTLFENRRFALKPAVSPRTE